MRSNYGIILLALLFGMLLSSCSDDSSDIIAPVQGPQPGGSSSEVIGTTGGTVNYGNAYVIIPAGTLDSNLLVTVGIPEEEPSFVIPEGHIQIGYVYKAEPEDSVFVPPASVVFTYNEDDLEGNDESSISIWT